MLAGYEFALAPLAAHGDTAPYGFGPAPEPAPFLLLKWTILLGKTASLITWIAGLALIGGVFLHYRAISALRPRGWRG